MKKILIFGIVFILLSSFVNASLDDAEMYLSFDTNTDDESGNNNDATNNGASQTSTGCILGNCYDFTPGDSDYMEVSSFNTGNTYTISAWVERDEVGQFVGIITRDNQGGSRDWAFYTSTNTVWRHLLDASNIVDATSAPTTSMTHVILSFGGSTAKIYVDGVLEGTLSTSTSNGNSGNPIKIGSATSGASEIQFFDGTIDEVAIWSRQITDGACSVSSTCGGEVATLYNSGAGFNPYTIVPSYIFEINATSIYDNSKIDIFNATITNSTGTYTVSTTNGSVYGIYNQLINLTLNFENFYSRTYQNINTSINLESEVWQSILILNASDKITNTTVSTFNATVGTDFNMSSLGNTTHYVNAGFYTINAKANDRNYNTTKIINLTSKTTIYETVYFAPNRLTITASEILSGAPISEFNIIVTHNNTGYFETFTNISEAVFYGVDGIYNVSFIHSQYADQSIIINLTNSSAEYDFQVYTTNSIYFEFFNEVTLESLNGTLINIELISDYYSINDSTDEGYFFVDLLNPVTYTIRSSAEGFGTRFYEYTLVNNTNIEVDIYLVNESNTNRKDVTLTVYDQDRSEVENAVIKVLRYDVTENTYSLREIARTNFEGQVVFDLVLNEEYYKFVIEYDGETKLTTEKTQIYAEALSFQINIGSTTGETYFNSQAVDGNVIYINSSDQFRFSWNDPNAEMTKGCIEVYEKNYNTDSLLGSSCALGTSGVVYQPITPANGSVFYGFGIAYFGDDDRVIDSYSISFDSMSSNTGSLGWFGVLVLTVLFATIGFFSILVMTIIAPLPLLIFSLAGLIQFDSRFAVGIWLVSMIIGFIVGGKQ